MSSVAYATQEILIVLALAGTAFLHLTWWAAAGVVVVLLTVVAAYRQNVHAYPSGGGDYEVANTNLGPKFGLVVAAALLVDYVLTVAVSTSAGVENLVSTPPFSWMASTGVGRPCRSSRSSCCSTCAASASRASPSRSRRTPSCSASSR